MTQNGSNDPVSARSRLVTLCSVKVSRAPETSGPIGAVIDLDRSHLDEGRVVLTISGEVDVVSVPRLRAAMADVVGHADVVVDLSGVSFCDSSVLRLLVDAQRDSAAADHVLEVAHPSGPVRELFEVSGLRGVLHVTS